MPALKAFGFGSGSLASWWTGQGGNQEFWSDLGGNLKIPYRIGSCLAAGSRFLISTFSVRHLFWYPFVKFLGYITWIGYQWNPSEGWIFTVKESKFDWFSEEIYLYMLDSRIQGLPENWKGTWRYGCSSKSLLKGNGCLNHHWSIRAKTCFTKTSYKSTKHYHYDEESWLYGIIQLMEEICANQLRLLVYPCLPHDLQGFIRGCCGFLNHQQYLRTRIPLSLFGRLGLYGHMYTRWALCTYNWGYNSCK